MQNFSMIVYFFFFFAVRATFNHRLRKAHATLVYKLTGRCEVFTHAFNSTNAMFFFLQLSLMKNADVYRRLEVCKFNL